jgi:ABC-type sugar transport system ATPase subunit
MAAGRTVATVQRGEVTTSDLVRLMVGSKRVGESGSIAARREKPKQDEATLVETRGLVLVRDGEPINQTFRVGELVGIAGLEGQGQGAFLRVLAGVRPLAGEVHVTRDAAAVRINSRRQAHSMGVAYVPRDRQSAGIFATQSIRDNFGLPTVARDRRFGLVSSARTRERFARYIGYLKIKLRNDRDPISTLSGGNQQKVVVARWLAAEPKVLLLDDPTRGVDPGAKHDLYEMLVDLANAGLLVIMISTDVDELIELMDRVLVFREGTVFSELKGNELDRHTLVSHFFGREGGLEQAQ